MAIRPLIVAAALLSLVGCATTQSGAYRSARVAEALASAPIILPAKLPDACTAKIGRVVVSTREAWVSIIKRWEIVADNRNQQADDCAEWWDDYRSGLVDQPEKPK